jgi:hypothetical protein
VTYAWLRSPAWRRQRIAAVALYTAGLVTINAVLNIWYCWVGSAVAVAASVGFVCAEQRNDRARWVTALESDDPITALAMLDFIDRCRGRERRELLAFLARQYDAAQGDGGLVIADDAPASYHRMMEAVEPPEEMP